MKSSDERITVSVPAFSDWVAFASLEGFDEISRPFRFDLTIVSDHLDLRAENVLGTPATVIADGMARRYISGLVAEFGLDDIRNDKAHYKLTVVPWLWFLSLRTDNRIFQSMSVLEIVKKVCAAYPHFRLTDRTKRSYPRREYCVQYGESDLNFVQRLLEHEGIFYHFDYGDGTHSMVIADDQSHFSQKDQSLDYLFYLPGNYYRHVDPIGILAWKPMAEMRPEAYAQTDYDFTKPSADLMHRAAKKSAAAMQENYHYPGNYVVHPRGDGLTKVRLEEAQTPMKRVRAQANHRLLRSGCSFLFRDFPRATENEKHYVLRTDYQLWDGQYRSGEQVKESFGFTVTAILAPETVAYRPPRLTPKPVMKGPQTAVVVGPSGEEIFTDEYARVKVQFHWDRSGGHDQNTTCFIRVSQTWAGAGWGFIQIPRIGQEVIVDFLEGDPDQPIITGRVYNGEQMPPYGLPGSATQSGWKSNSSPGGGGWNELRFEDKAGSEEVYFQAQKDHNELVKNNEARTIGNDFAEDVGHDAQQSVGNNRTESVGNDKSTSVGNNRTVSIGTNDTETVGSNRALTVGSNETISIGSNSTETIGMNHSQTVGVAQTITVGGLRVDSVGATEARTVGASQTMTIGTSRDVTVGAAQTHSIGANDTWTVGAKQEISVAADQSTSVGANQSNKISGDQSWSVGGNRAAKVGKDAVLEVAAKMGVKVGASYMLEVADEIAIKCGSAAIVMKKDGTITIEGKDITVKASGKIGMQASSDITMKGSKINQN